MKHPSFPIRLHLKSPNRILEQQRNGTKIRVFRSPCLFAGIEIDIFGANSRIVRKSEFFNVVADLVVEMGFGEAAAGCDGSQESCLGLMACFEEVFHE